LLSVKTSEPLSAPSVVGTKLISNWQELLAASVAAVPEPALTSGQADAPLLFKVKLVAILGLLPADGSGKLSAALPIFAMVTACGVLVAPYGVVAKFSTGGTDELISETSAGFALEKYTLPAPSTAVVI
jgi:hypothetical protein